MLSAERLEEILREGSVNAWKIQFIESIEVDLAKTQSPIERVLYLAIRTMLIQRYKLFIPMDDVLLGHEGVSIEPQVTIGSYRVDFLLTLWKLSEGQTSQFVIEADSQKWHERTEEERRYEKERDRYFISNGFKPLHYTGKEILEAPLKVAYELYDILFPSVI